MYVMAAKENIDLLGLHMIHVFNTKSGVHLPHRDNHNRLVLEICIIIVAFHECVLSGHHFLSLTLLWCHLK